MHAFLERMFECVVGAELFTMETLQHQSLVCHYCQYQCQAGCS